MPQLFLPGMPDGATRINAAVSRLEKEGRVTWFVGADSFLAPRRRRRRTPGWRSPRSWTTATPAPATSPPPSAHRTDLERAGVASSASGARVRSINRGAVRGATVLMAERLDACSRRLDAGERIAAVARSEGIGESTLRKAVAGGRGENHGATPEAGAPGRNAGHQVPAKPCDRRRRRRPGDGVHAGDERTASASAWPVPP
ncbi:MAG: hypothetical protein U1F77_19270 [Kiritimatiellia bacterium]